jgi:hypothetical protein
MVDRYTKAVLTIIAGALVALVMQNYPRSSSAQEPGCGGYGQSPCAVAWSTPMPVYSIIRPQ